ncbi:MAG: triose-phosphate isomerase [Bacteroidetes bacterium]|nr:triose-phosphate isomerase [Bacteroidota bacterium]
MKHIYLNLKRFDIPVHFHGINRIAPMVDWARAIIRGTDKGLKKYRDDDVDFTMFFPEAHLIGAAEARSEDSLIRVGSQGVYRDDTAEGGNFGAFTTNLTANAVRAMRCESAIIGHCEERRDKLEVLNAGGVNDTSVVNKLLNSSVKRAVEAGLDVLYCIGEKAEEQAGWQEVLRDQILTGLEGVDTAKVAIAYEPVWAIGPGKTPPDRDYIRKIAGFVKEISGGLDVVYGGGLKVDNAEMLASIDEIDGGLIALTRFTGDIGFYPDEYLEIIATYFGK